MSNWINTKLLPPVLKFVNTKAINALKNGMVYSLPFIIIGSIFLILANFPLTAVSDFFASTGLTVYFNQAYAASFGIMAVFSSIGIAYVYVRDEGHEPLPAALTSFVAFLIVQKLQVANPVIAASQADGAKQLAAAVKGAPQVLQDAINGPVTGVINTTWLGGQGMIADLIVALLVGWSYSAMINAGWKITLPEQVPANVANQFTAMIPSGVIIFVATVIYAFFDKVLHSSLLEWIYQVVQTPIQGVTDTFGGAIIIAFLVPFFWFFGVHGGLIMGGITGPMLIPNSFANAELYKAGKLSLANGAHIVTNEFYNNFINLTGSGITIGLLLFMLIAAKSQQFKALSKVEAVPTIFNINEPFLFGLPIVMNPFLALPFFLTPVVVAATTYIVIATGIVPPLNGMSAPWTTPAILSGFLIGGWKMMIWQTITLGISTAIYWPFAAKYDKILLAQEQEAEASTEA